MAICEGTDTANQNAKLFQSFIKVIQKDYIVKRQRCFAIITWEFRRSKNKQEKGGWVAVHPPAGSQRPATPVVSRDSGILSAKMR